MHACLIECERNEGSTLAFVLRSAVVDSVIAADPKLFGAFDRRPVTRTVINVTE